MASLFISLLKVSILLRLIVRVHSPEKTHGQANGRSGAEDGRDHVHAHLVVLAGHHGWAEGADRVHSTPSDVDETQVQQEHTQRHKDGREATGGALAVRLLAVTRVDQRAEESHR